MEGRGTERSKVPQWRQPVRNEHSRSRNMGLVLVVLTGAMAEGCGGGGYGGGMTNAYLSSAPGDAAMAAFLQADHHLMLSATDSASNSYTLQIDQVANAGTTTFNGVGPAYSDTATVLLTQNATQIGSSVDTSYYLLNPVMPLGKVNSTGSPYAIVTSSTPIPMTLTVGNSGAFDNVTYYHDSTMAVLDANEVSTYTVTSRDSMSLLYCVQAVISGTTTQGITDGMADGTETDCYAVTAAGMATAVSVSISAGGVTLTFK
jgi:hypothetical protein